MLYEQKDNNMSLKVEAPLVDPCHLPWDLRTIIECQLSIDEIQTLESGAVLQVGEVYMSLVGEVN